MPTSRNDDNTIPLHITKHIEEVVDSKIEESERRMMAAFPDYDLRGHHDAHKSFKEKAEDRKKLISSIREKIVGGVVWAMVVGMATALFQYLKESLR